MAGVAKRRNAGAYSRQVSCGDLASTPLTGKKSSVGLRTTWYTPLMASIVTAASTPQSTRRQVRGTRRSRRSQRRRRARPGQRRHL